MKVRKRGLYRFKACGLDRWDRRSNTPADGTIVRVCHPYRAGGRERAPRPRPGAKFAPPAEGGTQWYGDLIHGFTEVGPRVDRLFKLAD
jgi:hypothetical protein